MPYGDLKIFAASLEITFPRPIAFGPGMFEADVQSLCAALNFRIKSEHIRLRLTDALYNYELHASFFGDSGSFVRNADRMNLGLSNARTSDEIALVLGILKKFANGAGAPDRTANLSVFVHLDLGSIETKQDFLSRFKPDSEAVISAGATGLVVCENAPLGVKIAFEASLMFDDAVFISFQTSPRITEDNAVERSISAFAFAANEYGLEIPAFSR